MGKAVWYIFILILVFLLVEYYKGATSVGGTLLGGLSTETLFLQGRNSAGQAAAYPQG